MLYKYYSCNIIQQSKVIGSRVVRVYFFRSPLFAYAALDKTIPPEKVIVDFKRVR